jgi:dTDP-glucose 4,6-dehydratase
MPTKRTPHHLLVTGGAGFIGSAFIRYLLQQVPSFTGRCINLDALTYAGNLDNLTTVADDPRYSFVQGSISDQQLVGELCDRHAIDTVVHLAAESHVDRSIRGPGAFIDTNIVGTFHLLEVIRQRPHIHLHHVSTDEVYGCLGSTGAFTEETPYHPNSPYSASKAASDHLVRAYATTYAISTCLSNCSNNYGPYQFPEKLIPLMVLNSVQRHPLHVYGQGHNVRDWLHVDDHANALWTLLNCGEKGHTYNIGGNAERRNIDIVHAIADTVAELQGLPDGSLRDLITFVNDRPGHDFRYAIDCSKLQRECGWRPQYTFENGLRATIQWYLDHPEWVERVQSGAYRHWLATHYAAN